KGWLNLVERPGDKILVHVVGRRIHVRTVGRWDEETPRTELVFIGVTQGWSPSTLAENLERITGQSARHSAGGASDDAVPDRLDTERLDTERVDGD
ncbi:MAG: GTP-binding protein, partial [Myxococcota bacterium]